MDAVAPPLNEELTPEQQGVAAYQALFYGWRDLKTKKLRGGLVDEVTQIRGLLIGILGCAAPVGAHFLGIPTNVAPLIGHALLWLFGLSS